MDAYVQKLKINLHPGGVGRAVRRVSSLVIYAWVITKPLKTKKKSTKRDAWVRKDELELLAL
jgi:hypothetical protein